MPVTCCIVYKHLSFPNHFYCKIQVGIFFSWIDIVVRVLQKENLCKKWSTKLSFMSLILMVSFFFGSFFLRLFSYGYAQDELSFINYLWLNILGLILGVFGLCRQQKYWYGSFSLSLSLTADTLLVMDWKPILSCVFIRLIRSGILWLLWVIIAQHLAYHKYEFFLLYFPRLSWISIAIIILAIIWWLCDLYFVNTGIPPLH